MFAALVAAARAVTVGSPAQRPAKQAVCFSDRQIIDAGVPDFREPGIVELPILIAVRSMPLARGIVRLVSKTDCDAATVK